MNYLMFYDELTPVGFQSSRQSCLNCETFIFMVKSCFETPKLTMRQTERERERGCQLNYDLFILSQVC